MEDIYGKIAHVIYANEANGYAVISFKLEKLNEKNIICTGMLCNIQKDFRYHLQGEFIEHPRYGLQFSVSSYEKCLPNDEEAIIRFLSGPQFVGVGKKSAQVIVETLGKEALNDIRNDHDILDKVPNMNPKKKQAIIDGLASMDDVLEKTIQFFTVYGIGPRNIMRLNMAYGKEAIAKVSENPYRVIYELDGFGFKTADKLAMHLGFSDDDPLRKEAYLVNEVMNYCMKTGDTFIEEDILADIYQARLGALDFADILKTAIFNTHLVKEDSRIYHPSQYQAELQIAAYLNHFPLDSLDPYDKQQMAEELSKLQQEITYNDLQLKAIDTFFEHDLMILTGGPGTGKTTVVKALTYLFKKLYPANSIVCIAPTGRASKRIAQLCNVSSSTIHSLLQWNLETNSFGKNMENPLDVDVLIIDEFSMVDNYLFANLCNAGVNVKKICIIGDVDQLPSVSPGSLLHDLIKSDLCPVVCLKHIYRQQEGSDIVNLAFDISNNEVDLSKYHNDLRFFACDRYQLKDVLLQIVHNAFEKGYDVNDVQVLSAMYRGLSGVDNLNATLQKQFNPSDHGKREIKHNGMTFRENDKILQLKNQPDDDVYNGDIGIIEEIVMPDELDDKAHIIARFDDIYVDYTSDSFDNITLAYCITIHKSQGSEYPIVILPLFKEQAIMMQRRLIYTAITRAKKSLILLGDQEVFFQAIAIKDKHQRQSTLDLRLDF
ncbi:MAG: ATP-dependent RecD-like DNA helicase [Erysipelotrichaceae bacterium]|nr:ATP-dependent RecD-like DNA helicase [Erysipelotrichaceae bacterium]MDY5251837.1 ATP-dependent RecD-like DNA helicase [Erysipelotrichaceae bacterium]